MKKTMILMAAAIVLMGCGGKTPKTISPLPSGLDSERLTDCCVAASFTSDDFGWMGGNLKMTAYSEDLYDAVEVSLMAVGDTLVYDGEKILVKKLETVNGLLTINGGLEEGGAYLQGYEGGTYRAVQMDDHSVYSKVGYYQIPLSEEFIIVDCGLDPSDPSDTVRTAQKLYLETLEGYRRNFSPLDTKVLVENGLITEINRRWIP